MNTMKKELYVKPCCEEMELAWAAALCQASGTESFGLEDDLVYPDDYWK